MSKMYNTLFTTQSGIEVKRMAEVADQYNLLVKNNRTGQILLNKQPITEEAYRRLLIMLQVHYPDACVYASAYQFVFVYPNAEPVGC